MTSLICVVLVVFVCGTWAQGPPDRVAIQSCETDRATRHQCVVQRVQPLFDSDKVEACFKTCPDMHKGKDKDKGKGDMGGHDEAFFKCVHTAKQGCIKTNAASVQLVDATPKGGPGGGMDEHRGWWQHGGGPGGGPGGNLLDGLLRRATDCNVKDCVTAALGPDLLKDTAAGSARIEKAMCTARQACPPSAQCTSDRTAVRAAECTCKSQEQTFMSTCKTQFPPSGSGPGSWSGSGPAKFAGKGDHNNDPCSPPVQKPCPA